jgi:hypothetical protein
MDGPDASWSGRMGSTSASTPSRVQSYVRPHSARARKSDSQLDNNGIPTVTRLRRPWTAHPKTRSDVSPKRVVRPPTLKKSHFRRASRTSTPSSDSTILTAIGLENAHTAFTTDKFSIKEHEEIEPPRLLDLNIRSLVTGE